MSGAELVERYLKERSPGWSGRTLEVVRESLDHLLPFVERGLTRAGVVSFVGAMRSRPWSWRTLARVLQTSRALLSWAARAGLVLEDLSWLVVPPRGEALPRTLSEEQVLVLLEKGCSSARDRAIVELLYGTGLRRSELTRLSLADVDLCEGLVRVRRGKGMKDRLVPMGETAREALLGYLRHERLLTPAEAVFVSAAGRPLGPGGLWMMLSRASVRAGLAERASPHRLRHSYATHLLRGGADIVSIKALLGHSSLHSTEVYTGVDVEDLKDMLERCHPRERQRHRKT